MCKRSSSDESRALRNGQTQDAQGRLIPPAAATRGQVQWWMRGAENLTLIGRAEQFDIMHGMASSYACVNCCPDSFSDGFVTPDHVTGFPGDETQFFAEEFTRNCYGQAFMPYTVNAMFSAVPEEGVVDCRLFGAVANSAVRF